MYYESFVLLDRCYTESPVCEMNDYESDVILYCAWNSYFRTGDRRIINKMYHHHHHHQHHHHHLCLSLSLSVCLTLCLCLSVSVSVSLSLSLWILHTPPSPPPPPLSLLSSTSTSRHSFCCEISSLYVRFIPPPPTPQLFLCLCLPLCGRFSSLRLCFCLSLSPFDQIKSHSSFSSTPVFFFVFCFFLEKELVTEQCVRARAGFTLSEPTVS